jgi:indoleamine 2,3-dioxygenase
MFNGCTDEAGFILMHIAIETQSNKLVQGHQMMFEGARSRDRDLMNKGMLQHLKTLQEMHSIMSHMWHESSPKGYLNFRTFIMGIKGNEDIFPNGVLYEGVSDIPFAFRGETGA